MEGPVTTGSLGAKGNSDLEEETGAVGVLVPRRVLITFSSAGAKDGTVAMEGSGAKGIGAMNSAGTMSSRGGVEGCCSMEATSGKEVLVPRKDSHCSPAWILEDAVLWEGPMRQVCLFQG